LGVDPAVIHGEALWYNGGSNNIYTKDFVMGKQDVLDMLEREFGGDVRTDIARKLSDSVPYSDFGEGRPIHRSELGTVIKPLTTKDTDHILRKYDDLYAFAVTIVEKLGDCLNS